MEDPAVVIGIGEIGGVFARGLLRAGRPVYPVTREMDPAAAARSLPDPALVVVAVAEADLHSVLDAVPGPWRDRLVLIQNELLPGDWETHGIAAPTVCVVWFEKKPGTDVTVILPSPVAGPGALHVIEALTRLGIAAELVADADLAAELVLKNLYILIANIAGLEVGGTVGELWATHRALARRVGDEILALQEWRCGRPFDPEHLYERLGAAFAADPDHRTTGRSAPHRLARALEHAARAEIAVPELRRIATAHDITPLGGDSMH